LKLDLISKSIEVLIDTGFAGSLVVPQNLSDDLVLQFEGFEEFYTVTGQLFVARAYSVEANWLGERIRIPIAISPGRQGRPTGNSDDEALPANDRLSEPYFDN